MKPVRFKKELKRDNRVYYFNFGISMDSKIHEILKKYWGYSSFRPLQEEIIQAALNKQDALALLPTGGGKSICFQIPAIVNEGMCLVVSPLIALMKDQVLNLQSRNIAAIAITSGMRQREIDIALDNCVFGRYKFLYVSPERLASEMFLARVVKMNINLLAIDESHCISQWGYDFRPSYLKIAELRSSIPKVPVMALTATATSEVVEDIQEKLEFKKKLVFAKSFERKNLVYLVQKEEDKLGRLLKLVAKTGGSGIVYVRSRKRTENIANELQSRNIVAEAYHAGLSSEIRDIRQTAWIKGQVQIIVATNAFGMGIDKPDVSWVVHIDLPDTIEAYFQEAGRAGRDEKRAYAVVLHDNNDLEELKRKLKISYPEKSFIRRVYKALGNFYKLADHAGKGEVFPFDLKSFSKRYTFNFLETFSALRILENDGVIALSDAIRQPSRLMFLLDKKSFYNLEVNESKSVKLLQVLLRSYSGLLDNYVIIDESVLAKRMKVTRSEIIKQLNSFAKRNMIDYVAASDIPQLTFVMEKLPVKNLIISKENYDWRKARAYDKMNEMLDYILSDRCRSAFLLQYFGEKDVPICGVCDYCRQQNPDRATIDHLSFRIMALLEKQNYLVNEIFEFVSGREDLLIQALDWLEETQKIEIIGDQVQRLES